MNLNIDIFTEFDKKWALLCAGSREGFNAMTVSWGGMGTLWSKPVVTVYVRKSRYTYEFMEKSDCFTLSFYPDDMRGALGIMGSKSGRGCDKVKLAGLEPVFLDGGVTFNNALRTIVCKKLYSQEFDPKGMTADISAAFYPAGETLHTMYIGEVTEII